MPHVTLRGVKATVIGTPLSSTLASAFAPLPTNSRLGDGRLYVIIPGACSIGVELENTTKVTKKINVRVALP